MYIQSQRFIIFFTHDWLNLAFVVFLNYSAFSSRAIHWHEMPTTPQPFKPRSRPRPNRKRPKKPTRLPRAKIPWCAKRGPLPKRRNLWMICCRPGWRGTRNGPNKNNENHSHTYTCYESRVVLSISNLQTAHYQYYDMPYRRLQSPYPIHISNDT